MLKENNINNVILSDDAKLRNIKMLCNKCNKEFLISYHTLLLRIYRKQEICIFCMPYFTYNRNNIKEKEISTFIEKETIYTPKNIRGLIVKDKTKDGLGLEIDAYIHELKLGFEFNGLYWHNELKTGNFKHKIKTEEAEKENIHLIHIFEDDWKYKNDIVKSNILSLFNKFEKEIESNNCEVKIVDNIESNSFLEENHIKGKCNSKINLGLYFNNDLISLMVFGNNKLDSGNKDARNDWFELMRFCNKKYFNVKNSHFKLFSYFIEKYNYKEIVYYADRNWICSFKSNIFIELGFKFEKITNPNYYFIVDGLKIEKNDIIISKILENKEDEFLSDRNFLLQQKIYRIYDSGSLKYQFFHP